MPQQNNFFTNLKNLFRSTIIITNKSGRKKIVNLNQLNTNATLEKNFTYNPQVTGLNNFLINNDNLSAQILRVELYRDYEVMDRDSFIASALDIYSDETATRNIEGKILSIKTENSKIKEILEDLFYNVLNIEFNIWSWVRNLVKYGDFFLKLDIVEKLGIVNAHPLSVYAIERIENFDGNNSTVFTYNIEIGGRLPFLDAEISERQVIFQEYEIAHFRLLSDTNFLPYGKSMLELIRRDWKRLYLLEDAMLIHRITRAPEKRIFKIDVGNIPPEHVDTYIEKIMSKIKKAPIIDEQTGEYNLHYNVMNMLEDFVFPVRGGQSGTEIDTLPGLQYEATEDVEYFKKKILTGLKIPSSFLGFEESVGDTGALTSQDIRFAHTIERIQRIVESELTKIAMIHLYTLGFSEDTLSEFKLQLTRSSQVAELQRLEIIEQRLQVATTMKDTNLFSYKYILSTIFDFTDEEIEKQKEMVIEDKKFAYRVQTIEQEGRDPAFENENESEENNTEEKDWNKGNPFESYEHEIQRLNQNVLSQLKKLRNQPKILNS